MVEKLEVNGVAVNIDVSVNNAAIDRIAPFLCEAETGASDKKDSQRPWAYVIATNLLTPVRLMRGFLPSIMQRNDGTTISISSRNAGVIEPHMTSYSASKATLTRVHDCLDAELRDRNEIHRGDGKGGLINGIMSYVVQLGDVLTTIAPVPGAINMGASEEVQGFWETLEGTKGMTTEMPELVAWTVVKLVVDADARGLLSGRYINAEQDLGMVLERAKEVLVQARELYFLKIEYL